MIFSCHSCKSQYKIADERVRNKVLKIRCKKCGATITLKDQEGTPALASVEAEAKQDPSQSQPPRRKTKRKKRKPRLTENWYYVKDGKRDGPHTFADLDKFCDAQTIRRGTLVWHPNLDGWKRIEEVDILRPLLREKKAPQPAPPVPAPPVRPEPSAPRQEATPAETTPSSAPEDDDELDGLKPRHGKMTALSVGENLTAEPTPSAAPAPSTASAPEPTGDTSLLDMLAKAEPTASAADDEDDLPLFLDEDAPAETPTPAATSKAAPIAAAPVSSAPTAMPDGPPAKPDTSAKPEAATAKETPDEPKMEAPDEPKEDILSILDGMAATKEATAPKNQPKAGPLVSPLAKKDDGISSILDRLGGEEPPATKAGHEPLPPMRRVEAEDIDQDEATKLVSVEDLDGFLAESADVDMSASEEAFFKGGEIIEEIADGYAEEEDLDTFLEQIDDPDEASGMFPGDEDSYDDDDDLSPVPEISIPAAPRKMSRKEINALVSDFSVMVRLQKKSRKWMIFSIIGGVIIVIAAAIIFIVMSEAAKKRKEEMAAMSSKEEAKSALLHRPTYESEGLGESDDDPIIITTDEATQEEIDDLKAKWLAKKGEKPHHKKSSSGGSSHGSSKPKATTKAASGGVEAKVNDEGFITDFQFSNKGDGKNGSSKVSKKDYSKLANPDDDKVEYKVDFSASKMKKKLDEGGGIDDAKISKLIKLRSKKFLGCKKHALTGDSVKITLFFTVTTNGSVSKVNIKSSEGMTPEMASCLKNIVSKWHFWPIPEPQEFSRILIL